MDSFIVEKIRENLAEVEPDAAGFAAVIANHSALTEAVCAMSGIERERLRALADGERFTLSEFLALRSVADFLTKDAGKDGDCPLSRLPEGTETARTLRERFGASVGLEEWLSRTFAHIVRANSFCDELLKASGGHDLEAFLSDYHFFIDASALCADYMSDFLAQFLPLMKRLQISRRITIPYAVVASLKEMSDVPELANLSGARHGLTQIQKIQDAGLLSIRGDKEDATILSTFLTAFSRFKPTYHMVLLTQDEVLAQSVSLLNRSGLEGDDILIAFLGEDGVPALWSRKADGAKSAETQSPSPQDDSPKADNNGAFSDADFPPDKGADAPHDSDFDNAEDNEDEDWLWRKLDLKPDANAGREEDSQTDSMPSISEELFRADDSWAELE